MKVLSNILSIISIIVFIIVLAFALWFYFSIHSKPAILIPYSYRFNSEVLPISQEEQAKYESANILIVGDRMAKNLGRYKEQLSELLSKKLSVPLKIEVLSGDEGLNRTLWKLKSFKKLPKIIIFHGTSQEWLFPKIDLGQYSILKVNNKNYDDPHKRTYLHLYPQLSNYFFLEYRPMILDKEGPKWKNELEGMDSQKYNELLFKYFEYEVEELIQLISNHNSHLIIINAPINLEVKPKEVCENAFNDQVIESQKQILNLIGKNDYKTCYSRASELVKNFPGNSVSHFLNGVCLKKLNQIDQAYQEFELSSAFDCKYWRASPIFNSILFSKANFYNIPYLDFQQLIYENWEKNVLFQDELFPQQIYYEKLLQNILTTIAPIIGI